MEGNKKPLNTIFLVLLALSLLSFLSSLTVPQYLSKVYILNQEKIISNKVKKAKIKFENLVKELERREGVFLKILYSSISNRGIGVSQISEIARSFLREDEGVILLNNEGKVDFWFGKVFNPFNKLPDKRVFIVKDMKSHFLSIVSQIEFEMGSKRLIFVKNLENKIIEKGIKAQFIDWREEEGIKRDPLFEKEFSIVKREEGIQVSSPFNISGEGLLAIFSSSSPPETLSKNYWRDFFLLIFYFLALFLLILMGISLKESLGKFHYFLLLIIVLMARLIIVFVKRLLFFKDLKLLKPDLCSISSTSEFLNSPLDIFLTVLTIFLIFAILAKILFPFLENLKENKKIFKYLMPLVFLTTFPVIAFQIFVKSIIYNTSRGLFHFLSPFPLFMLFLIFISFLVSFFSIVLLFKAFYLSTSSFWLRWILVLIQIPFSYFLFKKVVSIPLLPSVAFFLISALLSYNFSWAKKGSSILLLLILSSLFLYFSIDHFLFISKRSFIEKDLKDIIFAQERWSEFILRESIKEIDSQANMIEKFLFFPKREELAYQIWLKTTAAKLRWPSAIEILDREGEVLSSFSLNLPIPESVYTPFTERWWVEEASLPFFDKIKRVRFGYKGILGGREWLGKIIFYISSDYDAIPILYRESPYYSILRGEIFPPSPVMERDFGFAVFDEEGSIIFNPSKIPSALGKNTMERLEKEDSFWSSTRFPMGLHHIFYFRSADRIFAIFYPVKGIKGYCLEIMEITLITFIYFTILLLFFYFTGFYKPEWLKKITFSTKVRIVFLSLALLPFIIFSIFSNFFLQKLFIEQMKSKAIGELETAKGIFTQFFNVERENIIPQDLVLWVGSIIARDINIYLDGILIGSSRGEIFLFQYLPYHLDGEIYHEIIYKGSFYYLKKEKMGKLVYFTLSSPMKLGEQKYIISIPLIPEIKESSFIGREFMEFLSIMFFFFAIIASIVSQSLYRKIIGPIKILLGAYRDVGKGNLEIRIETKSKDEIRELMEGFNSMVKELKVKQEELKEMERRQAWAEMAKKAAHEIKNPLTPILLMTEHLLKVFREDKEEFERNFEKGVNFIINEVKRLKRISSEFISYSQEKLIKERFDFKKLAEEIIEPLRITLKEKVDFVIVSNQESIYFDGDIKMMETVLRNAILNAIEAIKGKGKIEISLTREDDLIKISVIDSGEGIPPENISRIFEPYFTTKPSGTGLGLSIARKMVEMHGGKISVESEMGKGTKVTIELPL